jgi:hypothetical protein
MTPIHSNVDTPSGCAIAPRVVCVQLPKEAVQAF